MSGNYAAGAETFLVTGGAGFIGSSLVDRLLSQGKKVIVIDNFNDYYDVKIKEKNVAKALKNHNFRLYKADINDTDVLEEIFTKYRLDCVVHLAARAGVRPSLADPLEYVRSNVAGTVSILEKMREHQVKKLVFASSSSVYGNCTANKFSEDLKVTEPISPYAATKLAGEQMVYTYAKLYDIHSVCLRFFTVYGPRQRPDLAIRKFITAIKQNEQIHMYGDGSTKRDYTYIDDILDGIEAAITYNQTPYEIINLGGGSPVTLKKMIATLEDALGQKAHIVQDPMQPGDVNKTVADITKAKKLLGFQPQTGFTEGIKNFMKWYEQQESSSI